MENDRNPYAAPSAMDERPRPPPNDFLRNLSWYAFGFWTFTAISVLLEAPRPTESGRYQGPVAIALVLLLGSPLLALVFGSVYAAWLRLRTARTAHGARLPFWISFLSGVVSFPMWFVVLAGIIQTLGFLGEAVNWVCIAGLVAWVMALAEISLRGTRYFNTRRTLTDGHSRP